MFHHDANILKICRADVGRVPGFVTRVQLSADCLSSMGIILHEILHALGMFHEQNRPDRDDHIEIFTAHIAPKMQHSFEILPNMSVHGTKYDIESIMHYGPLDFALSSAHPTMLPKRHAPRMGQRRTLTHLDVVKLQNAYRCDWPEPGDEHTVQRYSPTSSISTTTEASLKANMSSTTSELLVTDTLQSNKHISVHVNETVTVSRNSSRSTRVSTKFTTAKYDVNATTSTTKAVIPLHATTGEFIATTAKSSYDNPYLPYREYSTEAPPPANPAVAHCFLPSDPGTCEPSLPRWHYDSTDGVCKRFFFSGCGGNKNNFETQLHCLFHCGKAQDKCKLPKVVGPCRGLLNVYSYYFDKYKRACLPFEYGGCQGNANRFPSAEECQKICAHVISPPTPPSVDENVHTIPPEYPAQTYPTAPRQNPYLAICSMPADAGACDERQARYYYDISQGKCLSFTYTGCGGNQNHFHTLEQCEGFCAQFGVGCPARTCDIQCPYGYENDPSSCPTCRCVEPCRDMQCPAYAACTVQTLPNGEFVGTCTSRLEKAGTCPSLEDIPPGSCDRACGTDNECHGQQKCCNNGCGTTCMTPVEREEIKAQIIASSSKFASGSQLRLECRASGYPQPRVRWYLNAHEIISDGDRSQVFTNGTLLIKRARASDAGVYQCQASNEQSSSSDSLRVFITGASMTQECTDNEYYANCRLIVVAKLCTTSEYYAKFCCKSCTEAGQMLPNDYRRRRKRSLRPTKNISII
ncbi:papilin-like isoform X2 [Paramacrobiotus metropolitanus]|uniref:papilin-like isoform X2 n=1 Tax=Paramacrobiotus metropolitanus TaxID=2943436 RepID=UPI002445F869|nr:papilin-like isoform X2 [Paramacrobiotus metropolitanus]